MGECQGTRLFNSLAFKPAVDILAPEAYPTTSSRIKFKIGEAAFHEAIDGGPGDRKILHQVGLAQQILFHSRGMIAQGKKLRNHLDK